MPLSGRKRLDKAVRREIVERVERARREIEDLRERLEDRVHEARCDLKKARAVLRLARPRLARSQYEKENAALREAGRALSDVRDAQVLPGALDRLLDGSRPRRRFPEARRSLSRAARAAGRRPLRPRVAGPLSRARRRARKLRVGPRHWRAVSAGLRRSYAQTLAWRDACLARGSDEDLHEWRKATKYLRYQLELLRGDHQPLGRYVDGLHRLTDLLGEDHDLVRLRSAATRDPAGFGGPDKAAEVLVLIDRRRAKLQDAALKLGKSLFARSPRALETAWRAAWRASVR